jgi:hypothetical protein
MIVLRVLGFGLAVLTICCVEALLYEAMDLKTRSVV